MKKDEQINKLYRSYQPVLRAHLQLNKRRCTAERDLVLHYCCEMSPTFTPDKLVERAKQDHVSRATVYNTLGLLVDAHIVQVLERHWGMKTQEYELVTPNTTKCFTRCIRCGRIAEFKDNIIADRLKERRYNNFQMESYSLYVYGKCITCRRIMEHLKHD